jgi:hypothetical protein
MIEGTRTHGDGWSDIITIPRSADPPSIGGEDTSAGAAAAAIGGDGGGFSLHRRATAWDAVCAQALGATDLREWLEAIEASHGLRER